MKKITILLSSALTLLLITSNNASAAFAISNAVFADQPNKNSNAGVNPKRNRLGDDISGYGYKNMLKKGNVFKGNVRMPSSSNRSVGFDIGPVASDQAIMTRPYRLGEDVGNGIPLKGGSSSWKDSGKVEVENSRQNWGYRVNEKGDSNKDIGWWTLDGSNLKGTLENNNKWLGPLGGDGVFVRGANEKSGVIIGDNHFIGEAGFIGENGFIGTAGGVALEHGPGISGDLGNLNTGTISPISKEEKPRTSIQLKFIEGAWREVGDPTPTNPARP